MVGYLAWKGWEGVATGTPGMIVKKDNNFQQALDPSNQQRVSGYDYDYDDGNEKEQMNGAIFGLIL